METKNHLEAVELFRKGPDILEGAIAGVTGDESRFVPAPGKWSIREIARHVADTEIVAGMRLRQIIAEDRPLMAVFDQELWASNLQYADCDPFDSAAKFRLLREDMSSILAHLPKAAFDRVGLHPERGAATLLYWVESFGQHAEKHTAQILRNRRAWKER
jgi:hypothetical protein